MKIIKRVVCFFVVLLCAAFMARAQFILPDTPGFSAQETVDANNLEAKKILRELDMKIARRTTERAEYSALRELRGDLSLKSKSMEDSGFEFVRHANVLGEALLLLKKTEDEAAKTHKRAAGGIVAKKTEEDRQSDAQSVEQVKTVYAYAEKCYKDAAKVYAAAITDFSQTAIYAKLGEYKEQINADGLD